MGTICWCVNTSTGLDAQNLISIAAIIVNAGLGFWIVRSIQSKLNNKRVLKDHFIGELKEIRQQYRAFMNELYSDAMFPNKVMPWFKLMNIKINDILEIVHARYKIDKKTLDPYQAELRDLITENDDFVNQYRNNGPIIFSTISKQQLMNFQQRHNHLFNELIIKINDAH